MKVYFYPILLLMMLSACTNVKEPEFRRIDNFRLKDFGFSAGTIAFQATYYNPNNFGVRVKEAEADVYIDSVFIGKFLQDSLVEVARNADFSIPLSGKIPLATALKIDLNDLDQREILLRAEGSVKVGKAGVFVSKPFNYQGKHRLEDINLKDLKF